MPIEDDITRALAQREQRSTAMAPTLVEIEAAAASDLRLVPGDDSGHAPWHASHRRVQLAGAAAAVLVLLVGGLVVLRSTKSGESAPVFTGPTTDAVVTWRDAPLLAPVGADWYIESWNPNLPLPEATPTRFTVWQSTFESRDLFWGLNVEYVGDGPAAPETGLDWSDAVTERTTIAGRDVQILGEPSGTTPDPFPIPRGAAIWKEGSFEVVLYEGSLGTTVSEDGTLTPIPLPPSAGNKSYDDLLAEVVASIQPVSIEEWSTALQPADGALDSTGYPETRSLRLGPSSLDGAELSLRPWVMNDLTITGGDVPKARIQMSSEMGYLRAPLDPMTTDVAVRGVDAQLARGQVVPFSWTPDPDGSDSLESGVVIRWREGTSEIVAFFPDEVTDDEALAYVEALVVLDDAQWESLLFPDGGEPVRPASSTTTMDSPQFSATDPSGRDVSDPGDDDRISVCVASDPPTWAVFLHPDATPEQIDAVGDVVADPTGASSTVYFDQDAAYEEFATIFADSPEMLDTVTPEILPPSFRVWTETAFAPPHGLAEMAGVREIVRC